MQSLDFRAKQPSLNEKIYGEMEKQSRLMSHLHHMILALLRRMVEKKLITPEEFTLMSADRAVNDDFVLMLGMVAQKLDEQGIGPEGLKLDYRPTFGHRVTAFFKGEKLEVRLIKKTKTNDEIPQALPDMEVGKSGQTDSAGGAHKD